MGKYDQIFHSDEVLEEDLTPQEAITAIAVVTAAADTSLDTVDVELISDIIWGFEIFTEYSDEELLEIIDRMILLAEEENLATLFNTANECIGDDLVLDGFAAGVSVLVDENEMRIPQEKMPLVKALQTALDIDDEEAKVVIDDVINAFLEAENEDETLTAENLSLDVYESPLENFTIPVPVNLREGAKMQAQEGKLSFSDDFGTFLRIDYYPLPATQIEEIEAIGEEEYLRSIVLNKYIPQAIAANIADTSVEYTEYLKEPLAGAYFTVVNMPEGSTICRTGNNGTIARLDAYRGIIAFIKVNFLYIISSQRCFFDGETPEDIQTEANNIKDKIFEFIDTIEFT
ncbi:hypothetical protein [Calothrix sp. 336/3]|uniref:hypothetical protein n=1 Tax=Calothrix sp. 336/3 TaxID=1337936 RepID=UPI0004E2A3B5|nr:hypothetical protein [Calothrix sp. 336/3]AKG20048.1 hypothetical protein IJ00_00865 [Calothrix sp. 336/3]